jgi:hypothetical protein
MSPQFAGPSRELSFECFFGSGAVLIVIPNKRSLRGEESGRAARRVFDDAIIARLARILVELHHIELHYGCFSLGEEYEA